MSFGPLDKCLSVPARIISCLATVSEVFSNQGIRARAPETVTAGWKATPAFASWLQRMPFLFGASRMTAP
jgi:hypothetical protein